MFVCLFGFFFEGEGRGGEGRGGSGKNDWVVRRWWGLASTQIGSTNVITKKTPFFFSSRVLIQNLKSFIRYRKPMQSLIHSFEINCGVKM